ncbi:MAG: hypothetical protein M3Y87_03150 [Myxococcota bacterium]|nr:hypothetical protein [Myxococcota bacterium]
MSASILRGDEAFHDGPRELGATVSDFWRWAYSDLVSNSNRALVAEYLVTRALGATSRPRIEWDAVDVVIDGVKVEVKCAGYVQTWAQKKPSMIRFDIGSKLGWDAATNTTATVAARSADVYVFCLHAHRERETLDVLDLAQWELYVLPRRMLDAKLPTQRTASLTTLVRIGAQRVPYEALASAVLAAGRQP